YLIVNDADRRVYISHGTQVDVLDADSYELKGTIKHEAIKGVHGIAVAPDLGRGFISNGQSNCVTVFDLKSLKPIGEPVKTGATPTAYCTTRPPSASSPSTAAARAPPLSKPPTAKWRAQSS